MSAPVVVIIGRPNVGKSTFFNRVLGERRAVVHDQPGITRDRHTAQADWAGRAFVLVDTGGFLPTAAEGRDALVRRQAEIAIDLAQAVLLMVDAHTGVTDLDVAIARQVRKTGRACLVVVNKVDKPHDPVIHDFHRLGIGDPIPIASESGYGVGDLLDKVIALLPPEIESEEKPAARVAIIGRPNVGKSSIVNALLQEERMVVEPKAGTTMDAIDTRWSTRAGDFVLVDTAGIRRKAMFDDQSEFYATMRALHALERADLACLVVDTTEGFEKQEARLVGHVFDAGCSLLVLYNKWDLIEDREQAWKDLLGDRRRRFPTLADLPAMPVSATEHTHLHRLGDQILKRIDSHRREISTKQLNQWLERVQRRRAAPSTRVGRSPKMYYATQTGIGPPEVTVFVNHPDRLLQNYRRYLWLDFNDHFDFQGTPVRMRFRRSE